MHEQRFYHEVLGPFIRLLTRSAENVCVHANSNDVISLATSAAASAYHFHEAIQRQAGHPFVPPMADKDDEELRQHLSDVADSSKHGLLRKPERLATFKASLAFEFNDSDQFRYLRTEVFATNQRFGTFNVTNATLAFIKTIGKEHGINLALDITLPTHPFKKSVEIYLTPQSGFDVKQMELRFYKRNPEGILTISDPPNGFDFLVLEP